MKKRILKALIIGAFVTAFYFVTKIDSDFLALNASTSDTKEFNVEDNICLDINELDTTNSLVNASPDPALFGISVVPYTGEYDGNAHSISIVLPKTITNAIIVYSYNDSDFTTTNFSFTDVGNYTVKFKIMWDSGKKLVQGSTYVTINKKTVNMSSYYNYQIQEFTYDGKPHFPNYTVNPPAEATDVGCELIPQTDAGTYSITYSFVYDTTKYIIPNVVLQWKINPKTVSIIWGDGVYFDYDGQEHKPTASYLDINASYHSLTLTCEDGFVNAGKHTATATKTDNLTNYKLPDNADALTHEFTIYPKDISSASVVHGSTSLTYNGLEQGPSVTSVTLTGWDEEITYELQGLATNYSATDYTLKVCGTGNYSGEISIAYQINKKAATVVWPTSPTYIYNGQVQTYKPYIVDVFSNDMALDVTFDKEFKNAGTYTATVTEASYPNYALTNVTSSIAINPKQAAIVYENTNYTYNGQVQEVKAYFMNCSNAKEYVTVSIDKEFKNADDYSITCNVENITNYTLSNTTTTITIDKFEATIIWPTHIRYVYYHNVQQVNAKITDHLGNIIQFVATTDREFKDAGTYDVEVNEEDYPNYSFTNPTWQAIMNPATSTIVYENTNYTYNGQVQEVKAYYVNGLKNKEYVDVTIDKEFKNAGDYSITCDVENITNYTLSNTTTTITIAPLEIEVNWSNNNYTYNGNVQEITAKYVDVLNNEHGLTVSIDKEFKNADSYKATTSLLDTNYSLTNPTKDYNILPLEVNVVWTDTTYTFNGNVQVITAYYVDVNDNQIDLTITTNKEFKNKDDYLATASNEDSNYTLTNNTHNYSILPFEVEAVWCEDNYAYNGKIQKITAKYYDLFNYENALGVSINESFRNVGDYTATAIIDDSNYIISNPTKDYKMQGYEVVINWSNDDYVYNGSIQEIKASYVDHLNNTIDLVVSVDKEFKNAGTYKASVSLENANYNIPTLEKEYTILPCTVVVTWCENSYTFNGNNQVISASYVNCNGKTIDLEVTTANPFKNAGVYEASVSLDSNYTIANPTKEYIMYRLNVETKWIVKEYTYNGDIQVIEAKYIDVASIERMLSVTVDKDFKDAGDYLATASIDNNNYNLTNETKEYSILPCKVETIWNYSEPYIYDGLEKEITATFNDVFNKPCSNLSIDNGKNIEANSYVATASSIDPNYVLINETKEYTISPKNVKVNWEKTSFIYNGQAQEVKAYFTNVYYEDIDVTITIDGEFKNAGEYEVVATYSDSNYTLTNNIVTCTISPLEVETIYGSKEYTYNGKNQEVNAYYIDASNNKVDLKVTCSKTFMDEGEYDLSVLLEDTNYVLTNTTTTCTIKPYPVIVDYGKKTYYYDGSSKEIVCKYKDVNGNDVILKKLNIKNVGDYNVNFEIKDHNYILTGEDSVTITMNKGILTIPNTKIITYDYTGNIITYIPEGFDEQAMNITNNKHAESNMDGYSVVISIKDKENYSWKDGTTDDKTYTFKIKEAQAVKKGCTSSTIPSVISLLSIAGVLLVSRKRKSL